MSEHKEPPIKVKLLPEIEFVVGWSTYSPGQRIRPTGTLREILIRNGYAKLVDDTKVGDELTTRDDVVESKKRKRGRPRKQG